MSIGESLDCVQAAEAVANTALKMFGLSGGVTMLSQALGMAIAKQAKEHGAEAGDPRIDQTLAVTHEATKETVEILMGGA